LPAITSGRLSLFLVLHADPVDASAALYAFPLSACMPALAVRRWVDDCHAAVICSDPKAARQLLAAATAAGPGAEFRLRGYADAGSGTRKLPGSGAVAGVQPAALLLCFWLRC
jgi:hypothetical protein